MTNCVGKKKKNPWFITFLHLWQKHLGLLYSNVAGLVVVLQLGVILLDKNHLLFRNLMNKVLTWRFKYMRAQDYVRTLYFVHALERQLVSNLSSMYLSCTCKDFFTNLYKDFCAEGDKCLWNNWVGGGEKGRKKSRKKVFKERCFLGSTSFYITYSLGTTKTHYNVSSSWPKTWQFANCGSRFREVSLTNIKWAQYDSTLCNLALGRWIIILFFKKSSLH